MSTIYGMKISFDQHVKNRHLGWVRCPGSTLRGEVPLTCAIGVMVALLPSKQQVAVQICYGALQNYKNLLFDTV